MEDQEFVDILRQELSRYYEGEPPMPANKVYDFPDIAKHYIDYRDIIEDIYRNFPHELYPYFYAPSRPGQTLLDQQTEQLLTYPVEELEDMFQAIQQDTSVPMSWIQMVNEETEQRPRHIAELLARIRLGGTFVGEEKMQQLIDRISQLLPSRVDYYLANIKPRYYGSHPDQALADMIIGYNISNLLEEIEGIKPPAKIANLVPLASPPSNPSLNLNRTQPLITQQGRQLAFNYLDAMKFSDLKELAKSIRLESTGARANKEGIVNAILQYLTTAAPGTLSPILRQIHNLLVSASPSNQVERLVESPNLQQTYQQQTKQTIPETRPQMVQAVREAESTHVKARPSPEATPQIDPLAVWYQALETHSPEQVASALGMVVPPDSDVKTYIENNLAAYSPVIVNGYTEPLTIEQIANNPSVLNHYSDNDLFNLMGIYPPYNTRQQLIQRLTTSLTTPIFFMPINMKCANGNRDNAIAFGTAVDYDCFTPQELIQGYRNGVLILPNGYKVSQSNVQELRELAKVNPGYQELYRVLSA